jgi:hypothetical protein
MVTMLPAPRVIIAGRKHLSVKKVEVRLLSKGGSAAERVGVCREQLVDAARSW